MIKLACRHCGGVGEHISGCGSDAILTHEEGWDVFRSDLLSDSKKLFDFMWKSQQRAILRAIETLVDNAESIMHEWGPGANETYEEAESRLLAAPRSLARAFKLDETKIKLGD